jgi:hypothetical protein
MAILSKKDKNNNNYFLKKTNNEKDQAYFCLRPTAKLSAEGLESTF